MPLRRHRMSSASYRDAVLATNPVGYWRLGERSGTVARDEMGLNHGTYVGSPTLGVAGLLAGDGDTAVAFAAASSQYVDLGDPAAFRFLGAGEPFSFAGWVNLTDNAADQYVLSRHSTSSRGWRLALLAAGNVIVTRGTETLTGGVFSHGVRLFTVGTYDGSYLRLYVGGALTGTPLASTAAVTDPGGNTNIGRRSGPGTLHANGPVDDPAIWNRALTAAEIAELDRIGMGR